MGTSYWRGAVEDEAMQDEHRFIWKAMLDTIDIDLTGRRVLDAGCNRGGFLRLLVDDAGIAQGYGYDPASGAVTDARGLTSGRPLVFEIADTVPEGWNDFDVAFSHEVLYLLEDLTAHAACLFGALRPGGAYFAVMGVHEGSSMMSAWHEENAVERGLPRLYGLDEVAGTFESAGFSVSVSNLKIGFVPVSAHRHGQDDRRDLLAWLNYYKREKVLLRFTRPTS
jgi:SAM-dependent methyltransferase